MKKQTILVALSIIIFFGAITGTAFYLGSKDKQDSEEVNHPTEHHENQQVYEDNIKQYGTLTCYLCEEKIEFGLDNLEHKAHLYFGLLERSTSS